MNISTMKIADYDKAKDEQTKHYRNARKRGELAQRHTITDPTTRTRKFIVDIVRERHVYETGPRTVDNLTLKGD